MAPRHGYPLDYRRGLELPGASTSMRQHEGLPEYHVQHEAFNTSMNYISNNPQ
jgi:hypothetical protein